jgi:hypothetical protein
MRTRVILAATLGAMFALTRVVAAQSSERLAAAAPFSLWIGEWKGSGWSIGASGERTEFELSESVKERMAGTVLLVEGHGTRTSGRQKGTTSHDGLVIVYRDDTGRIRWNGHEASSPTIDAEVVPGDRSFQWSFSAGAQRAIIRFVITLDGERWTESGDVSTDGASWTRFMEMTLSRVQKN